jgi:hypothetical protein
VSFSLLAARPGQGPERPTHSVAFLRPGRGRPSASGEAAGARAANERQIERRRWVANMMTTLAMPERCRDMRV